MWKPGRRVASVVVASVVIAVMGALAFVPTAAVARDRKDDADARRTCRSNLMRVGELVYAAARDLGADDFRTEGWFVARLRRLRHTSVLEHLQCRADPLVDSPDPAVGWRSALSYPVRNIESYPLDPNSDKPQVLVVCPHHDDGAFVMTDDFDIRFLTRKELGAPASGPIVVGKGATHPALACARYETGPIAAMLSELRVKQARTMCVQRLSQLGEIFQIEFIESRAPPPYSGPALLAYYRKKHSIQAGREQVLICPLDPVVKAPRSEAEIRAYDEIDLSKSVRKYVSYAVRDFSNYPLDKHADVAEPIMACVHHGDGAVIVYTDSSVKFRDREYLGLGPDEPITVGPKSRCRLLRSLVMGPDKDE